jgi:AcrR family transcriptional regulator
MANAGWLRRTGTDKNYRTRIVENEESQVQGPKSKDASPKSLSLREGRTKMAPVMSENQKLWGRGKKRRSPVRISAQARETTTPRYDAQLEQLLNIGAEIFSEKGYHDASIRAIAERARMSLAGLYYYFRSKEELLFLIQDHAFGSILANLEENLHGVTDPREKLRRIVLNHFRYFIQHMAYQKVCAFEQEILQDKDYYAIVEKKRRRYFELVREVLREVSGKKEFPIKLGAIALFLFGAMSWIHMWYNPKKDGKPEDMAHTLTDLFLHGFLALGLGEEEESEGRVLACDSKAKSL